MAENPIDPPNDSVVDVLAALVTDTDCDVIGLYCLAHEQHADDDTECPNASARRFLREIGRLPDAE